MTRGSANRTRRLAATLILAVAVMGFATCDHGPTTPLSPDDAAGTTATSPPEGPAPADPGGGPAVVLRNQDGQDWAVMVEIARTPGQRAQGLMYRDSLGPDRGMIFVFTDDDQRTFWMKNTRLPLDMLFITKDQVVLGIVENAEPYTETPRRVDGPSRYVLEVNGGAARAHGLQAGDRVWFFGFKD